MPYLLHFNVSVCSPALYNKVYDAGMNAFTLILLFLTQMIIAQIVKTPVQVNEPIAISNLQMGMHFIIKASFTFTIKGKEINTTQARIRSGTHSKEL